MARRHILYGLLILALLGRGLIPAGFMPGMASGGHAGVMLCHGMDMDGAGQPGDSSSSKTEKPCPYAAEFITGKVVEAVMVPAPRWQAGDVTIFVAARMFTGRSVSFYRSRAPPVSFPI